MPKKSIPSAVGKAESIHDDYQILKHVSVWGALASILPLGTISFIGFCYLIGFSHWIGIIATLSLTGLMITAAIWWWWSLLTIVRITKAMNTVSKKFEEIRQDVQDVKRNIPKVTRSLRK